MKRIVLLLPAFFILLLPELILAHPGHGDHSHDGFSIIHYFTEPEHGLVTIGVLVSVGVALFYRYQGSKKKI